jgi:TPP-dependent pyruvate/acetoin dehydrogenase alpha subunit
MVLPSVAVSASAHSGVEGSNDLLEAYRAIVRAHALEARWEELEGAALPPKMRPGAIALAAAALALGRDDWAFGEGHERVLALLRGVTLADFVAHAFGRGPNPWSSRARRTLGADIHNGAYITHAAGVAWAAKMEKRELAVLAVCSEDIASTGEFHNGVNFAGVFKAPLVLLSLVREARAEHAADVASAYGIVGRACDGTDFEAVSDAVREARKRALAGQGPTLIEAGVGDSSDVAPLLLFLGRLLEARGISPGEREERFAREAGEEITTALARERIVVPTGRRPE